MYSLLYLSVATKLMQQEELQEILEQSRISNKDHQLTGCLAYIEGRIKQDYHGRFIQVLEGVEEDVLNVFERIKRDYRHKEVTVIKQGLIANRYFKSWDMGFEKIVLDSNSNLKGFFQLEPELLMQDGDINNNILLDFMKSFYKQL